MKLGTISVQEWHWPIKKKDPQRQGENIQAEGFFMNVALSGIAILISL